MSAMKKVQSELIAAAYSGDLEEVKKLVSKTECDPDKADNFKGSTPLHWACRGGHLNVAQWLVEEAGADPAAKNQDGREPLFFACDGCHEDVIRWLVGSCGVDVNVKDKIDGQTPLHRVCSAGIVRGNRKAVKILEFLIKEGRGDVFVTDNGGKYPEEVTELLPTSKWKGNPDVGQLLKNERIPREMAKNNSAASIQEAPKTPTKVKTDVEEKANAKTTPEKSPIISRTGLVGNAIRRFSSTEPSGSNATHAGSPESSQASKVKKLTAAFEQQNVSNIENERTSKANSEAAESMPTEDAPTEDEPLSTSTLFSRIKFFNRK